MRSMLQTEEVYSAGGCCMDMLALFTKG